jgi:AcrR family transcriptional regulator
MAGRTTKRPARYGGRDVSERQAARRARFLEAGLDLFGGERGYRATRVTDVCNTAGLSTRQFYEEFDTLEALLAELHLVIHDEADQALAAKPPGFQDLGPVAQARWSIRALLTAITDDPRHTRIAFVEVIGVSPRLEAQRLKNRGRLIQAMCQGAEAANAAGDLPPGNYPLISAACIGAVNGLLHDWVLGAVDASRDEIIDQLIDVFRAAFHASPIDH